MCEKELKLHLKGLCSFFSEDEWPKLSIPLQVKSGMSSDFPIDCEIVFHVPPALQYWIGASRKLLAKLEEK